MKIVQNLTNDALYCIECKELIPIGNKYAIKKEMYRNEIIYKTYHLDCVPIEEEDEDYLFEGGIE